MAQSTGVTAKPARFHYAWMIVAVAFLAFLAAAGVRSAPAVFIIPLEQEFGWSRATLSFAVGMQLLVYGLIGPFSAGLVDRFGLRKTMLCALSLTTVSFAGTLLVSSPWTLTLVWGLGVGLGTGSAALVLGAIIANRWFAARRSLAVGIMTGSAATGQLIFLPLLAAIVTHFGWRAAVMAASAIAASVLPLLYFLMRNKPSDVGLRPYGLAEDAPDLPQPPRANPFTSAISVLGEVAVSRDFWLISASFFVCGATTFGLIGTHFIPACLDHGISAATGADILAAMGVFNIVGTVASGWLTDRFDPRHLLCWFFAVRGVSLFFLPYAFDLPVWGLGAFGVFYGLDWITTVPPTVRLTTNIFGLQKAGIVYGWIMVTHQLGAAVFAYASGVLRTDSGDYYSAFIVSGAICLIAAVLVLRIGRPTRAAERPVLAGA
ncbi:MAG TPA: MFS transporter [Stellaceae bacterium]|nr:MFS transporter [Stellaceae bacterium]